MTRDANEMTLKIRAEGWSDLVRKIKDGMEYPFVSYLSIFLLLLRRTWGAWLYRDLTSGDTSFYFVDAFRWATEYSVNYVWSPLYTAYYGTLYKIVGDVYLATLLHRFVLVFVIAFMMLAILRKLLPAGIAWLVTAWWVVLPINFNSLYEVHLFAMVLPLAAVLVVLYKPSMWGRGIALGILLVQMTLVRNEIVIAFWLWLFICLVLEIRQYRSGEGFSFRAYLLAYGVPVLIAASVLGFFYMRNGVEITPEFVKRKHTLNVCQIYAFGYQQRYSDWTQSPWTECGSLMRRDFGMSEPTMMEAFQANPGAMMDHFLWNIRLFPAGLQVSLFNSASGELNPDYVHVVLENKFVLLPSILSVVLFMFALIKFYQNREYWWNAWIRKHILGWLLLLSLSAVMLVVVPMQRPRPSYMFLLAFFLMTVLGMCLTIVIHYFSLQKRLSQLVFVLMVGLPLLIPSHYSTGGRPLLNLYNRISPSREFIGFPGTGFIAPAYSQELCSYYMKEGRSGCIGYGYDVFSALSGDLTMGEILNDQPLPMTAILVNDDFVAKYGPYESVRDFLSHPEREGWKLVNLQISTSEIWRLYVNVNVLNMIAPEIDIPQPVD